MHGSLARKLRIYGYDVVYEANLDDRALIVKASDEDRWLLTSDKELYAAAQRRSVKVCLLTGRDDAHRVSELFRRLGLELPPLRPEASRCPICNSTLKISDVEHGDEESYYRCVECGKLYWIGSHWPRLRSFDKRVRQLLKA